MFFNFIDAMLKGDEATIRAMAEVRFAEKLMTNLSNAQKSQITFQRGKGLVEIKKDETDYG